MKKRFKVIICFLVSLIMFMAILFLFNINKDEKSVKGNITIWADESSYEYLNSIAQEFMLSNNKAKVSVEKISYDEYTNKVVESINTGKLPNIIKLDNETLQKLLKEYDGKISIKDNDGFIKDYSSNFTERMIQEVTIDDKIVGIPFTTKPIVLYLRQDLLLQYGYSNEEINTWDELIKMGKDVYSKSGGKIKILNATGKDYEYLVSLLIMQEMAKTTDKKEIKQKVNDTLAMLKSENILNSDTNGSYLARIASIEDMNEIKQIVEPCKWTANNAPSKANGSDRFYTVEADNLIIINKDSNNENLLVEKYVGAITTNAKQEYNSINNENVFFSYLNAYKSKDIESEVTNFIDKSPLVIMSNIVKKAQKLEDYNLYISVKDELIN